MSLSVSPELLDKAKNGDVSDQDFTDCIRASLPYAYSLIEGLARRLHAGDTDAGKPYAGNHTEPETENERGQLLRLMASDAMRGAMERQFGMRLAFQNCHFVAVFPQGAVVDRAYATFTSPRAQLLNQSPELLNC